MSGARAVTLQANREDQNRALSRLLAALHRVQIEEVDLAAPKGHYSLLSRKPKKAN
jgi:hypothetical protein